MSDETPTAPEPSTPGRTGTLAADGPTHPESAVSAWPPSVPADTGSRRGGLRSTLTSAIAGGLVGALAAGGIFLAADNDATTVVRAANTGAPVASRPSNRIASKGDVASIIAKAEPAVVAITIDGGPDNGGAAGTGFVISADGFIVTNNHVVEGATKIEVAFTNGDTKSARIVGRDPSVDLAVLKVDGTGLPFVELGSSDAVQVGDDVVAIGNALALEGGLSVTRGIISGTNRTVSEDNGATLPGMLQTDAAINPGNSGGPLLDANAHAIGVNTAVAGGAQNVGFAIPISRALPTIQDLRAGRKPAFLGVSTQDVTPALARELHLKVQDGAYVAQVTTGTPANDAGIRKGDVIIQIGDTRITSSADVLSAVRSHRPGDTVPVIVDRNGTHHTFDAKLTQRPDAG